jgi:protein-tyrosine phosphatase
MESILSAAGRWRFLEDCSELSDPPGIESAGPDAVALTHCQMGINRGPSLGFAVLLAQGWDPAEAIAAIRAARPCANVWYAADALTWYQQRTGVDSAIAAPPTRVRLRPATAAT